MSNKDYVIEPYLTGNDAEKFVEFLSKKTFLKPWVFRNPKCADGDEFSDVVVFFRNTIILIEVKGNKFNSKNPQRYLKEAEERHRQLKRAKGIIKRCSKKVVFKNEYFSFETDFNQIEKVYLISVSTGPGEMEIASGDSNIDYSLLDHEKVGRYLGFFNAEVGIHSFTANEMIFASKHIDTLKDFFWYLDFEKKFFSNDFKSEKGQAIIAVVDAHCEDLISIYILTYYWDEELNKTGNINLNKIFGSANIEKSDMVMYAGADTRKYLEKDETYKKIQKEKKISYFWDRLINYVLSEYAHGYQLASDGKNSKKINTEELKNILEEMSFTSRFERTLFSEKMREADEKSLNYSFRNMYSIADNSETLFSYSKIEYEKFPTPQEQNIICHKHLYSVWCRIKFGESLKSFRNKIKKTILITRHMHENKSALTFIFSDEIFIDKEVCKKIKVI